MNPRPLPNPFSSRFIRPGAIEFRCDEATLDALGRRLLTERRCQLTGPHGSGKSTLLYSLAKWWSRHAGPAIILRIGPDGRAVHRRELPANNAIRPQTLHCIDGWDGLGPLQRVWRNCRDWRTCRNHTLVTNHRARSNWSQLMACEPRLPTMLEIVAHLQRHLPPNKRVGADQVKLAFQRHRGNARETLFELYDVFEDQREAG